jgi:hypothetical protein
MRYAIEVHVGAKYHVWARGEARYPDAVQAERAMMDIVAGERRANLTTMTRRVVKI